MKDTRDPELFGQLIAYMKKGNPQLTASQIAETLEDPGVWAMNTLAMQYVNNGHSEVNGRVLP